MAQGQKPGQKPGPGAIRDAAAYRQSVQVGGLGCS